MILLNIKQQWNAQTCIAELIADYHQLPSLKIQLIENRFVILSRAKDFVLKMTIVIK